MYTTFQHNSKHYTYAGGVEAMVVRGYITAGQIQFLLVHIELKGYTAQTYLQPHCHNGVVDTFRHSHQVLLLGTYWHGSNFLHLHSDFLKPFVSIYSDRTDHQLARLVSARSEVPSPSTTVGRPFLFKFIKVWGLKVLLLCTKGNTIHTSAIFVATHTISHKYTLGTKPEEKRAWNFNKNPLPSCLALAWKIDTRNHSIFEF